MLASGLLAGRYRSGYEELGMGIREDGGLNSSAISHSLVGVDKTY